MRRIGVFVCHCGSNIAATVDVKKVVEMALLEQGVVHAEDYPYMCSEAGQSRIAAAIQEKKLTGIVLPQNARGHLPQVCGKVRSEPLSGGDRKHP